MYIVRLDFIAVGNMCVTKFPVQLYFHPEVRTHAPTINFVSLPVCALCNALPPACEHTYDTKHLGLQYFGGYISNFQRYSPPRILIRILALRDLWTGRSSSFWKSCVSIVLDSSVEFCLRVILSSSSH